MKLERQIAMVKSVAKNIKQKEKQQTEKDKLTSKMYAIMKPTNKALDEVTRSDLTEKEFKFIQEYIINVMKQPIYFYPNLNK